MIYMCFCVHNILTFLYTVPPEVFVSATSSRIAVGQSTNITCSITRSVPSDYTIEWTLSSTSDVTTTLNEAGETLMLTDIAENEFGIYTCTATNTADLSGSANTTVTIERGMMIYSSETVTNIIYMQLPLKSL